MSDLSLHIFHSYFWIKFLRRITLMVTISVIPLLSFAFFSKFSPAIITVALTLIITSLLLYFTFRNGKKKKLLPANPKDYTIDDLELQLDIISDYHIFEFPLIQHIEKKHINQKDIPFSGNVILYSLGFDNREKIRRQLHKKIIIFYSDNFNVFNLYDELKPLDFGEWNSFIDIQHTYLSKRNFYLSESQVDWFEILTLSEKNLQFQKGFLKKKNLDLHTCFDDYIWNIKPTRKHQLFDQGLFLKRTRIESILSLFLALYSMYLAKVYNRLDDFGTNKLSAFTERLKEFDDI